MSGTTNKTIIVNDPTAAAGTSSRAVICQTTSQDRETDTRIEITPAADGLFKVSIDQRDKRANQKRGASRSSSFFIDSAGLNHICGVDRQ